MAGYSFSGHEATKAITIARVSSDDQEEYSPDAQNSRIRDYCDRNNLKLLHSATITESSTRGDREKFMAIIKEASKTAIKLREPIAIVTDKVDRLQRGFKQQPILEKFREEGLLEYHFSSDNCVIHKHSPAKDLFMWNIAVALAQNYTDSLSDNVNRAKEQKLSRGEWIGQAPIGYLNWRDDRLKRHGRGKAEICLDPVRAPLVRTLFEKYATGCYSLAQLVKLSKEIGLTNNRGKQGALTKSHIHQLLQNPFYYGVMRVKTTGNDYPHIYEPIISKRLFEECDAIRTGMTKPHARYGRKQFLLRGLLTCANTGRLCTAQQHTKTYKNGDTAMFTYLVSYDNHDQAKVHYTREEAVLEQIETALGSLTIWDPGELKDLLSYISQAYRGKKQEAQAHVVALHRECSEIDTKLDRLTELRLADELNRNEYLTQKGRFRLRQQEIKDLLEAYDTTDDDFTDKLNYLIELASNAVGEFRSSSFAQKRELLQYVFQNLQLDGKKLVYSMASPFDAIARCNEIEGWCPLVDVIATCPQVRASINSKQVPYHGELKAA